ncbi:glycosyltransferase [Haliangium ochraceum]|uniref:Glycosyltransferase 2-like domain-containing protein n=1 Tax=Haliangium ochraceum (strain DSM 14365 / JCM 11303 / SMP-2) TaxID=502025 RepID=D0LGD7_HALO1|nr:glycosyltransferase [Haliangium ochraceum]ACY18162.1 hypothetical protein Hoch_5685 [Haliangium ochraceum DSM 14365]
MLPVDTIPLTVCARDEERSIGACLDALLAARDYAEARLPVEIDLLVVLDQCRDRTEAEVRRRGVACAHSRGGKVEAQRRGARSGRFQIFCDADVAVSPEALHALCAVMLADERVLVAFPPKRPIPPRRRTPLARALHVYNLRRGFSSQRTWFNGKLFAIRDWQVPTRDEVAQRARALPPSRFYDYAAGMRVDDIYLSRRVLAAGGPEALHETATGLVRFRAPETWLGMYRYYRRMRMELERLDALFPETRAVHARYGVRRPDLLARAPRRERCAWHLFRAALLTCRAAYRAERAFYEHLSPRPLQPWPAIPETKGL